MDRKEEEKIAKIIGEMTHYLLKQHIDNFDIHVNHHEKAIEIVFEVDQIKDELFLDLKEKLKFGRDEEIETYGWTLMGNTLLEIAPRLLDDVIYTKEGTKQQIKLIRIKHHEG